MMKLKHCLSKIAITAVSIFVVSTGFAEPMLTINVENAPKNLLVNNMQFCVKPVGQSAGDTVYDGQGECFLMVTDLNFALTELRTIDKDFINQHLVGKQQSVWLHIGWGVANSKNTVLFYYSTPAVKLHWDKKTKEFSSATPNTVSVDFSNTN